MSVASHTETPIGVSKWLGNGKGREDKPAIGRRYGSSCLLPTGRAFRLRRSIFQPFTFPRYREQ
ncbi:MAG: hypothetical protein IKI83_07060 [Prevotella sp.]|nr:hypothetical protein [Prevotella sp.]